MRTVVFDIDGVLNNLVEATFKYLGLPANVYSNTIKYDFSCGCITPEEKSKCLDVWRGSQIYNECDYCEGIERLPELAQLIDVTIHSLCMTEEAAEAKRNWLNNKLDTSKCNIHMEVGKKTPLGNVFVVVEDNLEYLNNCTAEHKILISHPYNKECNYDIDFKARGIHVVNNVDEAITYIMGLI